MSTDNQATYNEAMSFWRNEVIDFALDHETRLHMEEQLAWIAREPANARPYFHLAQFYRMNGKHDEARGLLLEAVRLDPSHAEAHASLSEIYAIRGEYDLARTHARAASENGVDRAAELLRRHGIGL
jgi:tetratricopeptide (TPR) repeat protein